MDINGLQANNNECQPINVKQLHCMQMAKEVIHCFLISFVADEELSSTNPVMTGLLQHYKTLFDEPSGLPPRRHFGHSIPLLLGAQLVNSRPYQYNPKQKNEIEKQIA